MSRVVCARLSELLALHGLDLAQAFGLTPEHEPGFGIECFGLPSASALLVGNTQRLWPKFESRRAELGDSKNPLDEYVEATLDAAVATLCREFTLSSMPRIYFAHRTDLVRADGTRGPLPIQRLAAVAGLGTLGPAHLNVHTEYGPWISLRALVVLPCESETQAAIAPALAAPCSQCLERPCLAALERALGPADATPRWQRWLAVRDACPIGREHRFSDAQIRFHYGKLGH
jgi:methylmalonic aciduria homocystinuria type C protein